jgi:RNA polymerase sigma-70 factor (ECF subfamily)
VTKKEQFTTIYRQHYAKVFRLCKGYFNGEEETANDTVQEIFIKVWQHLDGFRHESTVSTWIYRISINCCLLYNRKPFVRKELHLQYLPDMAQEEYNPVAEERLRKMYDCIGQLDEAGKLIILLVLEGVEYEEIARVVGISPDTLRVRIHRIKKSLANCVNL